MRNTLFIGANTIKERTAVHSNIDDKSIMSEIKTAQDMFILPALGSALYNRLQDGIDGSNLTVQETALLDNYITDTLVYFVLSELPVGLSYQFYNKGLVRKSSENTDVPSMTELVDVANRYRTRAEYYKQRMIKFLRANANGSLFPEYLNPGSGIDTIIPERDGYQASIWLGNDTSCGLTLEQRYQGKNGLC